MDSSQLTASEYYNKHRKRSFFLSRITVMASMLILVIALGVNIMSLTSHNEATTESHASEPENMQKLLPSLAAGCMYHQIKGGFTVICPTPTIATTVPVNVILPKLPPECSIETSTTGSIIHCTTPAVPIPTVAVTLPQNCVTTNQANEVACKNEANKNIAVPLPSLPGGCSYTLSASNEYVVCESK